MLMTFTAVSPQPRLEVPISLTVYVPIPGKVCVMLVNVLVPPPVILHKYEMLPAEMDELLVKVKLLLQAFSDVVEKATVGEGEMINVLVKLAGQL